MSLLLLWSFTEKNVFLLLQYISKHDRDSHEQIQIITTHQGNAHKTLHNHSLALHLCLSVIFHQAHCHPRSSLALSVVGGADRGDAVEKEVLGGPVPPEEAQHHHHMPDLMARKEVVEAARRAALGEAADVEEQCAADDEIANQRIGQEPSDFLGVVLVQRHPVRQWHNLRNKQQRL
jgi:hypothetical protein